MDTDEKSIVVGYVNFDSGASGAGKIPIMVPFESLKMVHRGQYVKIIQSSDGIEFLARISKGPFFETDAVSKDSAFARVSILQASNPKIMAPEYHGTCFAQVIGKLNDNLTVTGTHLRPRPQAAVRSLTSDEIEKILGLGGGDIYLGTGRGYEKVRVTLPSDSMAALPRNVGIFGTIGSGKTNSSQVLIEEASTKNWTVVVLDVEGEYVDMDKPSVQKMQFKKFGMEPAGLKNFKVYHPSNAEPSRADSVEFGVPFGSIPPFIYSEILELSEPQQRRMEEAYSSLSRNGTTQGQRKQQNRNELDRIAGGEEETVAGITLENMIDLVRHRATQSQGAALSSWNTLLSKLQKLRREGIFDQGKMVNFEDDILKHNTVHVVDFSTTVDDQINNLIIFHLLEGIFKRKRKDRGRKLPKVLVVIEEAHSFVSREKAARMRETLLKLKEISRRGRKRWMGMCFVSQFPAHLPAEIYDLCNTIIAHQIRGGKHLDAIKDSTGGVDPLVWDEVPNLGEGECLLVSSVFKNRPLFCKIRPCSSKRRFVEDQDEEDGEPGVGGTDK